MPHLPKRESPTRLPSGIFHPLFRVTWEMAVIKHAKIPGHPDPTVCACRVARALRTVRYNRRFSQ